MANFTQRGEIFKALAEGKGMIMPLRSAVTVNVTVAAAASGFFRGHLTYNLLGTTFPGTLEDFRTPVVSKLRLVMLQMSGPDLKIHYLARVYKLGTLNLAATGDQFTHDAATFPITRTQFGVAAQPLTLLPIIQITTDTSVTAPVFRLRTAAGAAGYTNQDGATVIGTKTMTMPNITTVAQSVYIIRMEDFDSGVQDITSIEVTTAGTTGAANVWGLEILATASVANINLSTTNDALFGGLAPVNLEPGAATSGTATSYLTVWDVIGSADVLPQFFLTAVIDS